METLVHVSGLVDGDECGEDLNCGQPLYQPTGHVCKLPFRASVLRSPDTEFRGTAASEIRMPEKRGKMVWQ